MNEEKSVRATVELSPAVKKEMDAQGMNDYAGSVQLMALINHEERRHQTLVEKNGKDIKVIADTIFADIEDVELARVIL